MIRLFTTIFPVHDPARAAEYQECLRQNLGLAAIDEIALLAENEAKPPISSPKIQVRPTARRPTYADFFAWINELAAPGDISIIANSDIYFDKGVRMLEPFAKLDRCLALSRWDVHENGSAQLFERGDSQDVWIFRGPIRKSVRGEFPLGVYDCDNKIAWELEQAGYEVLNPAFSMRTYHLHRGAERSYDPDNPPDHGIRPPYLYVEPDNASSLFTCLRLWITYRPGYFPWRMTWRKVGRTTLGRVCVRLWNRASRLFRH